MVFFVLAGLLSLVSMGREAFPNISYDRVVVQTNYFGAPPQEIEKLITIKVEDELKEVDGIDEILSVSTENVSAIIIRMDPDEKDKRKVVNDIQRAVDQVDDLPDDLEDDPVVTEVESKNFPVINVSLSGDFTELELQNQAKLLETRLLDIPEVAKVARVGWRDKEIWVEVNPKYVEDYRLSLEDVVASLNSQNLNLPGGNLDTPDQGEYLVRTMGEFESGEEIKQVIIRANDVGNWIRVQDVAQVAETFEDDDRLEKTLGTRAITLTVIKKESGDIIDVVDKVKKEVENYQKQAPPELQVSFFDDYSYYVRRRLRVLVNNGMIGIILVLLSLFLFLTRSVAFMTALGIPTALAITFFFMNCFGLSINLITMFALIMVLGIIVDDSIVIAENIFRHMERGVPPKQAALKGAQEVVIPVTSTVLTTIAAFTPIFFMGGIMGKFIRVMPLVAIAALTASLIECLIILPNHMAEFGSALRSKKRSRAKAKFEKGFQAFRVRYLKILRWVVHYRYKALGAVMAIFVFAFLLFKVGMSFVLFPQGLIEEFFVRVRAPIGTSLQENEKRMQNLEKIVKSLPEKELDNFITQVGFTNEGVDDPYSDRGSHLGQVHVFLTPEGKRKRKADEIIEEIRGKTEPFKELFEEITYEKVRAGPPVGKPINVELRGDSLVRLEAMAEEIKKRLRKMEGVEDIKDDYDKGKTELRVLVDTEEAKKAYLSVQDIARTIRNAIDGTVATTIQKTDEEIDVIVRYPKAYRSTKEVFDHLYVPNRFDKLIAVNKVAKLEEVPGIQSIKRLDRKRLIQVTAEVDEKVVTPIEVQSKIEKYMNEELIKRYPDVRVTFGGEQEETQESLGGFFKAFILAIILIFMILACNFNSLSQPIAVMIAIPFGIVGVIFAFFLHGKPFSFMALLGLIGLSGVVVNDSIVLVDFINKNRMKGWSRDFSVFQAGRSRLRPVLLTSITTVAGLMPTAYGLGGSDPFVKPMALAIGWGLFFATALTLLIIPCVYTVFDDLKLVFESKKFRAFDGIRFFKKTFLKK